MRSVTPAASVGEQLPTVGKRSGRPTRRRTLRGRMRQPRRTSSVPITATGATGAPGFEREAPDPAARLAQRLRGAYARALGEHHHAVAAREDRPGGGHRVAVARAAVDGEGAERVQEPGLPALLEQLALGHVVDGPAHERADHERVEEAAVVGGQQQRPVRGRCSRPTRCRRK